MAKETPFDRARDFVEEKIDQTKEVLGDSYTKAREQFDDVSDDVRKGVKTAAKTHRERLRRRVERRARLREGESRHRGRDFAGRGLPSRIPDPRRRRLDVRSVSRCRARAADRTDWLA